jgi:hypothetical protein
MKNFSGLNEIIHSSGGQHLSMYLKNGPSLPDQANKFIFDVQQMLSGHHCPETIEKLLRPIESKLNDKSFLDQIGENIAVFRKDQYLRITNSESKQEDFYVLANTFHVKPLLSEKQIESKNILITCFKNNICLQTFDSFGRKVYSTFNLETFLDHSNISFVNSDEYVRPYLFSRKVLVGWLENVFDDQYLKSRPVFICGEPELTDFIGSALSTLNTNLIIKTHYQFNSDMSAAFSWAKKQSKKHYRTEIQSKVDDFMNISSGEFISHNFQEILINLLSGKVKKLVIASDRNIFGKVDFYNGKIDFTHVHSDHEDDDVLDDIAQFAIRKGVAPIFTPIKNLGFNSPLTAVISEKFIGDFEQNLNFLSEVAA